MIIITKYMLRKITDSNVEEPLEVSYQARYDDSDVRQWKWRGLT